MLESIPHVQRKDGTDRARKKKGWKEYIGLLAYCITNSWVVVVSISVWWMGMMFNDVCVGATDGLYNICFLVLISLCKIMHPQNDRRMYRLFQLLVLTYYYP